MRTLNLIVLVAAFAASIADAVLAAEKSSPGMLISSLGFVFLAAAFLIRQREPA